MAIAIDTGSLVVRFVGTLALAATGQKAVHRDLYKKFLDWHTAAIITEGHFMPAVLPTTASRYSQFIW